MSSEGRPLSAYEEVRRMKEPGLTAEQVAQRYGEWAQGEKYDKDLNQDVWSSPSLTAAAVAQYVTNKDVRILDVGAGTGKVASELKERGFNQVDALDGSEGMLEVARQKNLYQKYVCTLFEGKVDVLDTSLYDVLVCSGAMGQGLIKWYMLGEMVRCVKSGGLIVIIFREGALQMEDGFCDMFEPYVKQLESEGQCVLLERALVPGYISAMGVKFVFKVTKPE